MTQPNVLDAIASEQSAPVAVSGRLTTAQIVVTIARLGKQLDLTASAYRNIPDGTPDGIKDALKDIVKYAQAAIANAERLLDANR